ncbi:DUF5348 domain-containing protein [Cellulosilyticum sp. ST5]|uniref:DUF5348 domain-containing protein n=1 Tax=unclassified Cellulosilyticum TaxID=2643091 RepID=UPI000F8F09D6|nr:DUF5348 domain-containing protein [Cellulosilyticum sp. WCF-2]QEH67298.1 hypothetical protein EKH84_02140 [Cellulosilyticum sp. WCF-2]
MMDKLYVQHYQEIKNLCDKVTHTIESLPRGEYVHTMEEEHIYNALYKLNDALEHAQDAIEYCKKETKEGYIKESPYTEGRYVLGKHEFTCGQAIEIFIWGKWHRGRAEYDEEYYFVGCGNPSFAELKKNRVKVRIRI